jgi:hypothetical protein
VLFPSYLVHTVPKNPAPVTPGTFASRVVWAFNLAATADGWSRSNV